MDEYLPPADEYYSSVDEYYSSADEYYSSAGPGTRTRQAVRRVRRRNSFAAFSVDALRRLVNEHEQQH